MSLQWLQFFFNIINCSIVTLIVRKGNDRLGLLNYSWSHFSLFLSCSDHTPSHNAITLFALSMVKKSECFQFRVNEKDKMDNMLFNKTEKKKL